MAIQNITYADKEPINLNPGIAINNKVNATDMNQIKSVVNNNATELSNITGTILWTNPNPTTAFSTLTINLNSSDYDIYMILFKNTNTGTYINSSIGLKGYGTQLINSTGSTTIRRLVEYSSDTTLNVADATGEYSSTSTTIPIYVIGYKTGLFS